MEQTTPTQPAPVAPTDASAQADSASVTIVKNADGTFGVSSGADPMAQSAKTIDEALNMAREALVGPEGEGGMSVEKAFQDSFNGNTGSGAPGDMGRRY